MEIAAWLQDLGLEQYEPAFRANEIDSRVLQSPARGPAPADVLVRRHGVSRRHARRAGPFRGGAIPRRGPVDIRVVEAHGGVPDYNALVRVEPQK